MMVMMMVGEIIVLESAAAAAASSSSPSLQPTPSMKLPDNENVVKHKRKRKRRKQRKEKHSSSLLIENNASSLQPSSSIIEGNMTKTTEEIVVVNNSLQEVNHTNDESDQNTTATTLNNEICNNSDHDLMKNATNVEKLNKKKKRTTTINKKPKKNTSKKVTTTTTTSSSSSSSTGKEGECLRRIKHEWRDAVRTGIAYDWINHNTIRSTNTSSSAYVRIGPFGKNLLRWHFSVCGPANSVYENGIYHGRVLLPPNYPASPPRIQMITPSGRFIPGEDICLSASSYHPETWTPRWTVLSLVDALRLHMLTTANEIGGVLATDEKRKEYALQSRSWKLNGIANHEKMVAEGIFTLHNSGQLKEEDDDENNNEGKISPADESTAVNKLCEMCNQEECTASNSEQHVDKDLPHYNDASIHEKDATKKKAKKRKKKSSTTNNLGDESSSNATSKTESKRTSVKKKGKRQRKSTDYHTIPTMKHYEEGKEALSNEVDENSRNNNNIVTVVMKRLLVEILKFPLRILATLLRILDRLEKKLRSFLDSI